METSLRVTPLPGPFGVAVEELDLSQDMSDETVRQLIGLLHEHQILAIKCQSLSSADYVRFGYKWGKPLSFAIESHRRDDHPEMIRITNKAATPERYRDGAKHWHCDSTYEEVPASVTMLYGIEAPAEIPIYRGEIWLDVKAENRAAAEASITDLPSIKNRAQPGD